MLTLSTAHNCSQPLPTTSNFQLLSNCLPTAHNRSQLLTTVLNCLQLFSTIHNCLQLLTANYNHSQPLTPAHNCFQLPTALCSRSNEQNLSAFQSPHNFWSSFHLAILYFHIRITFLHHEKKVSSIYELDHQENKGHNYRSAMKANTRSP